MEQTTKSASQFYHEASFAMKQSIRSLERKRTKLKTSFQTYRVKLDFFLERLVCLASQRSGAVDCNTLALIFSPEVIEAALHMLDHLEDFDNVTVNFTNDEEVFEACKACASMLTRTAMQLGLINPQSDFKMNSDSAQSKLIDFIRLAAATDLLSEEHVIDRVREVFAQQRLVEDKAARRRAAFLVLSRQSQLTAAKVKQRFLKKPHRAVAKLWKQTWHRVSIVCPEILHAGADESYFKQRQSWSSFWPDFDSNMIAWASIIYGSKSSLWSKNPSTYYGVSAAKRKQHLSSIFLERQAINTNHIDWRRFFSVLYEKRIWSDLFSDAPDFNEALHRLGLVRLDADSRLTVSRSGAFTRALAIFVSWLAQRHSSQKAVRLKPLTTKDFFCFVASSVHLVEDKELPGDRGFNAWFAKNEKRFAASTQAIAQGLNAVVVSGLVTRSDRLSPRRVRRAEAFVGLPISEIRRAAKLSSLPVADRKVEERPERAAFSDQPWSVVEYQPPSAESVSFCQDNDVDFQASPPRGCVKVAPPSPKLNLRVYRSLLKSKVRRYVPRRVIAEAAASDFALNLQKTGINREDAFDNGL
jgi:hypothetical protein